MGLQASDLVMRALGIRGDAPTVAEQPPLVDGVHLRWAMRRERGFPWHGFYLFRRPSNRDDKRTCLGSSLRGIEPGQGPVQWPAAGGRLSSPAPLVFTDDFPITSLVEIDLRGRAFVRFDRPAQSPMKHVWVRIGLRESFLRWRCVRFDGLADLLRMPFEHDGLRLAAARKGRAAAHAAVSRAERGDRILTIDEPIEVVLPEQVDRVELELLGTSEPAVLEGLNREGKVLGREAAAGKDGADWKLALSLEGLNSVRITPRGKYVKLKRLCFGSKDNGNRSIRVEALDSPPGGAPDDAVVAAAANATGAPGDVVDVELHCDRITAVRVSGGDGALIDICWAEPDRELTGRWEPVPRCPQPITLPLSHPDYSARAGAIDVANAENRALGQVRYGPPGDWAGQNFKEIHEACIALVEGGPATPMDADARSAAPLAAAAGPGEPKPPAMPRLHPLDMLMAGSLHRPIAEIVGLSWTDETAPPGEPFDYMIVADHAGVSGGRADRVLAHLVANGFDAGTDAWITYDNEVAPRPPFQTPHGVVVYALPGGVMRDAGGAVRIIAGSAGVEWPISLAPGGWLAADAPVAHHLYRGGAGQAATPAVPAEAGDWLTKNRPVLYARPAVAPGSPPQTPPTWPPREPAYVDLRLDEGWYVYQLVAMDIFGRFSPKSPFAAWRQWAPQPVPRPWYYVGASSDAVVHPQAVRILDKTRPPIPLGLEAFVLDPDDPIVIKDAAYQAWRASLGAAGAGLVGLRVRWRWGPAQQERAPDVTEFRLYWSGGSPPPAGWAEPEAWPDRFFVCPFGANVAVETDGTRRYEVLLPTAAGGPLAGGAPLAPTLADPIAYANVSVTSSDAAGHTPDRWPGMGPFAGRPGNESQCAPPQKVFRVRRIPPLPPEAVVDSGRVYATPADWHGRSFHTFRWVPQADLSAHVWRALDEAVFATDWALQPRPALATDDLAFPDAAAEPIWNAAKKAAVAEQINAVAALLPAAPSAAAKTAKKDAALALYRGLSDDALRVLANRAGNDKAFVQVTISPLTASAAADRRGPDDAAGYVPQAGRCAYVDQVDGRATNRLLYRALFVDAAQNRSSLGPCPTPVRLPDVTAPRTPAITQALGGDRSVTLAWASNREADLAEYRVYRALSEVDARDLRTMTLLDAVAADPDPAARPASVTYTDDDAPGLRDLWYRVVAVDRTDPDPRGAGGNVSLPSPAIRTRAFDATPPEPPAIEAAEWIRVDETGASFAFGDPIPDGATRLPAIRLEWADPGTDTKVLIQAMSASDDAFANLSGWLAPGATQAVVRADRTFEEVELRLKVVNAAGNANVDFAPTSLPSPE